jgi:hypothetical protein
MASSSEHQGEVREGFERQLSFLCTTTCDGTLDASGIWAVRDAVRHARAEQGRVPPGLAPEVGRLAAWLLRVLAAADDDLGAVDVQRLEAYVQGALPSEA